MSTVGDILSTMGGVQYHHRAVVTEEGSCAPEIFYIYFYVFFYFT